MVREETEPAQRSEAPWQQPEEPGDSGTCLRICGMTWRTTKIQKKDEYGEAALRDDNPLFFQSPMHYWVHA